MTYEQYWYGDVWMVGAFREAERIRQERMNAEAHLQGMYFYDALLDVAPVLHAFTKKGTKPRPYPKKPYELFSSEKKNQEEELSEEELRAKEDRELAYAKLYMYNMVREGKHWGKG